MGKAKLQAELGVTKEKSEELFNKYHNRAPFVKQLMNKVTSAAQSKGQIKTLLVDDVDFQSMNLYYVDQIGVRLYLQKIMKEC